MDYTKDPSLEGDGTGATEIICEYLHSSSDNFPESVISITLLNALNAIFRSDGKFTRILAQKHRDDGGEKEIWEIYLDEENKGIVALGQSGSGLKTVLLVLLFLLVVPRLRNVAIKKCLFIFEELENNLHPALLRRLFAYLESFAVEHKTPIFITTHSSVALDVFGSNTACAITLVKHDGVTGSTYPVNAHFDRWNVISELGNKPSDLLQANGIIWVEGPSDRIYLNRWIQVASNGRYIEGIHYQCAFYGGSLLARLEVVESEKAEEDFINLIRINSNFAIIMDSDRPSPKARLKGRVERISSQVDKFSSAFKWITGCKEIENYLDGDSIGAALGRSIRSPEQYERFFPSAAKRKGAENYVETVLQRQSFDKVEMAALISPHISLDKMEARWDLKRRVLELVAQIERWNELDTI